MNRLGNLIGRFCLVASIGASSVLASAGEIAYEKAHFDAALAQGSGFVVALVTDWCTTCTRQEAVVAELLEESRFEGLTLFVADFDRELGLRRRLRVVMQGTFIVFKEGREVARSTGATDKAAIAAMFAKAL